MRGDLGFRSLGRILLETALLVSGCLAAFIIRLGVWPHTSPDRYLILLKATLIALTFQLFVYLCDVHDSPNVRSSDFALRLGQALLLASASLWVAYYLFPQIGVWRGVFAISLVLSSALLALYHVLLRAYFGFRAPRSNVLVLGTGRLARSLVQELLRHPELGFKVRGFIDDDPALLGKSIVNPKVIGATLDLPRIVPERKIDRIVVALQDRRGRLPAEELLRLKTRGIEVEDATSMYEQVTGKIAIENLKPSWLIFSSGFDVSRRQLIQKQIVESVMALGLLLLFLPVLLLVMVLIKLDSRGPIFHRQVRTGQEGRPFTLWKFRSMREDAERETGPVWADAYDKRVTRIGKVLRATRIDEVPQLFNVLRGEMSLVGPRPERPIFVQELTESIPFYHLRHTVKPGLTGWAQINNGYANSVEDTIEKLQYDLFYIKNLSLRLDSQILLETFKTCVSLKGY